MLKDVFIEVSAEFIGFMFPILLTIFVYQIVKISVKQSKTSKQ